MSCSCYAHPRIGYCKHIAAVELYFPQAAKEQRIALTAPPASSPIAAASALAQSTGPTIPSERHEDAPPTMGQLETKMRRILARAAVGSRSIAPDILRALDNALDDVLNRTEDHGVLPKAVAIPPNIRTATETARVLPRAKTKRKASTLREREPYSGGERSGKKARPDALHALPALPSTLLPPTSRVPPHEPQASEAPIAEDPREKENINPQASGAHSGLLPSAQATSKSAASRPSHVSGARAGPPAQQAAYFHRNMFPTAPIISWEPVPQYLAGPFIPNAPPGQYPPYYPSPLHFTPAPVTYHPPRSGQSLPLNAQPVSAGGAQQGTTSHPLPGPYHSPTPYRSMTYVYPPPPPPPAPHTNRYPPM